MTNPPPLPPRRSSLAARLLGLYLLLNLALVLSKLAHGWPVAAWSWWRVTCLLWGPWVLAGLGWAYRRWRVRRRR